MPASLPTQGSDQPLPCVRRAQATSVSPPIGPSHVPVILAHRTRCAPRPGSILARTVATVCPPCPPVGDEASLLIKAVVVAPGFNDLRGLLVLVLDEDAYHPLGRAGVFRQRFFAIAQASRPSPGHVSQSGFLDHEADHGSAHGSSSQGCTHPPDGFRRGLIQPRRKILASICRRSSSDSCHVRGSPPGSEVAKRPC